MKRSAKCKCMHCSELFLSDFRNRGRQLHCAKPECRKVARRSSQQRWLAKVENQNYFRGPENCARVREWRARHPGYWRKKKPAPRDALQEGCSAQHAPDKETATPAPPDVLQELCVMQPAVLVGLISTISGCALQEDIARIARSFIARGQDILGMNPGAAFAPSYETQAHSLPRTAAARAAPI
jgi:hypothetical protein